MEESSEPGRGSSAEEQAIKKDGDTDLDIDDLTDDSSQDSSTSEEESRDRPTKRLRGEGETSWAKHHFLKWM